MTTLLPGRACITPRSPVAFAEQLGQALARIHAHAPGAGLPEVLHPPRSAHGPAAVPDDAWDRLSTTPRVLTHHDFWSGNTLWRNGQLAGVVDWSGAGLAPRGFDISWARLDLVLLDGPDLARTFTTAYESAAASSIPDLVLWDLYAAANARPAVESWATNYQQLGRADLGPRELRRRFEEWRLTIRPGP